MRSWSEDELKLLDDMVLQGKSYGEMSEVLGRSIAGVSLKAQRRHKMKYGAKVISRVWTQDELDFLRKSAISGESCEKVAEELERSVFSVRSKASKLNIHFRGRACKYRVDELEELRNDWQNSNMSMKSMSNKYGRSINALKIIAFRRGFGPRNDCMETLTIRDVVECVGISYDRVRFWLKSGLKHKVVKSGRSRYYIKIEDLLEFMREHMDIWNATKVDSCLFLYDEPEWFKVKYRQDFDRNIDKWHAEYTDDEDRMILIRYKKGKSVNDIAAVLHRTPSGIKARLAVLSEGKMSPKYYSDDEIELIKRYAPFETLDELTLRFNGTRTKKSLDYKCRSLGIKCMAK